MHHLKVFLILLTTAGVLSAQSEYLFSDGGHPTKVRLAEDELFSRANRGVRSVATGQAWGSGSVLRLETSARKFARANWAQDSRALAPVFYDLADLSPRATSEARRAAARRVMTAKLHVRLEPGHTESLAPTRPLAFEASLLPGWVLVSYDDAFAALDAADWLSRQGGYEFSPVFSRVMSKRQILNKLPNDTYYSKQWHLQSSAFNLTMRNAWDLATGKDINIAIVDDGLEIGHEDLSANSYSLGQGLHINFNEGDPDDPSPLKTEDNHGTSCAGLAAAVGFNNLGVIGVAPAAGLMGVRLIAGDSPDDAAGRALAWQPKDIITHVSSNSWGPSDDGANGGRISSLQLAGIEKGARENRNGLGTVFAISAGNGRAENDDQSYDGFSSSRYAIAVAAVDREGKQSSYSESGMGVAISALGGEYKQPNVMWTTDNMGADSHASKLEKHETTLAPPNYTDSFNGTSAAAPQISGAIALMLERNPRLGYRDVKEILMRTANREGLQGKDEFVKNGADFVLSHSFGAGLVNVSAALELAPRWTNLGPLVFAEVELTGTGAIPDDGTVVSTDVPVSNRLRVEHVELTFSIKHANRGDITIGFISPSGMLSVAQPRPNDDNADFTNYTMTSVMHWGESSAGTWKLVFADNVANGVAGTITAAKLRFLGTAQ